jgi:hypothetical protein
MKNEARDATRDRLRYAVVRPTSASLRLNQAILGGANAAFDRVVEFAKEGEIFVKYPVDAALIC